MSEHNNKWFGGRLMAFSGVDGKTDFVNGLVMRSSFKFQGFEIKFGFEEYVELFIDDTTEGLSLFGDWFKSGNTSGAFIDAHHFIINGKCRIGDDKKRIKYVSKNGKTLLGIAAFFNEKLIERNVEDVISERQKWSEKILAGKRTYGNFLINAVSQMKTQIYSPEGIVKHYWTTPDRWPHRRMWLWDSVFHAVGLRHIDIRLAQNALDAVLDVQREDGFIPLCAPGFNEEMTQPPVLALGYSLINQNADDLIWIKNAYPKLKKYLEWDFKNRDTDGYGLLEWWIEKHENCRSGESGADNSPRFDSATQLDATDFNSMMALECEIMAGFAEKLNNGEAAFWHAKHKELCEKINERLWNKKESFYFDYDVDKKQMSEVMACFGFLPLICGACSKEQAEKLAEHIFNKDTFGTPLPVPSIAVKSGKYYSKDMWRGPVWININWLIAYGFRRYGMNDVADHIIKKTVEEIELSFGKYSTFFEFFDDRKDVDPPKLLRKGKNAPEINPMHQVFFDYGWTATLYVDMILEK